MILFVNIADNSVDKALPDGAQYSLGLDGLRWPGRKHMGITSATHTDIRHPGDLPFGYVDRGFTFADGTFNMRPEMEAEVAERREEETRAARSLQFAEINQERERRLGEGASFPVTGITDPVPLTGRPFDQTVYLALLTRAQGYKAAGVVDPALMLRDGADTIHSLTPDQMIELVSQAMTWFENVMARSWAMKDGTAPFEAGIPTNFTSDEHWP